MEHALLSLCNILKGALSSAIIILIIIIINILDSNAKEGDEKLRGEKTNEKFIQKREMRRRGQRRQIKM